MSELYDTKIKYCLSITNDGNYAVYVKEWVQTSTTTCGYFTWHKLKVFFTRQEAEEYFKSIEDLPKYK